MIVYGDIELLMEKDENIFAYLRSYNDEKLLVVLNFFEKEVEFKLTQGSEFKEVDLLISNYDIENNNFRSIILRPYEARVYRIKL